MEILLEDVFEGTNYVLVAMTNHPACYAVLKEQTPDKALVELVRTRMSSDIVGAVNWIATGMS
ncbi:hypothetical protein D3C73_1337580 [compost metagenome]